MTHFETTRSTCARLRLRAGVTALLLASLGFVVMALSVGSAQAAARKSRTGVPASQEVATLNANHAIYTAPGGKWEAGISRYRPITGESTTLPVLATRTVRHSTWLLVRLPGRLLPGAINGRTGWINSFKTSLSAISWHIVISLGQRRAYIYNQGRLVRNWLVVVGKPSTPTPTGQFFVEEDIAEPPTFPGAPYALATSARSAVFTEFDGGPGQIALHGIGGGLGGTPGQAQSHGCVRFTNADITWLANTVWPGTPITITN